VISRRRNDGLYAPPVDEIPPLRVFVSAHWVDIRVPRRLAHAAQVLAQPCQRVELVAQGGGALELQFRRGGRHFAFNRVQRRRILAAEEGQNVPDVGGVVIARAGGGAGAETVADLVTDTAGRQR